MNFRKIQGTGVALVTPFNQDYSIDYVALERIVKHVTEGGVDYLVVLGTTAESPTLSMQERANVLSAVQQFNTKNLPVVYGAGGNDTHELVEYISTDIFNSIDAVLSVTPYYNRPSQAGLEKHYTMVADASPVPIILYNVPARTSVNLHYSTTLKLANHPNIIAIKEASGDFNQINHLCAGQNESFIVLSGDDTLSLPMIALGAQGAISVIANALPRQFSDMIRAAMTADFGLARKLHNDLLGICECMTAEGNPSGLKYLMSKQHLIDNVLRLPLTSVSETLEKKIDHLLDAIK